MNTNGYVVITTDGNYEIVEAFDNKQDAELFADGFNRAVMDGVVVREVPRFYTK